MRLKKTSFFSPPAAAKYCAYWNPNFECSCSNDIIDIQTGPHPTCYVFNAGSGASFSSSCETLLTEVTNC